MSLREKQRISVAVLVAGALVGLIFRKWLVIPAFLLVAAGLALCFLWLRCPACGALLFPHPGNYCKHCGAKIEWDKRGK